MALIMCPECGKEISDKSAMCIHCGYPLSQPIEDSVKHSISSAPKQSIKKYVLIVSVIVVCMLAFLFLNPFQNKNDNTAREQNSQLPSGEQLSLIITEIYLDDIYNSFVELQDPVVDALINCDTFTSLKQIEEFELVFKNAIDALDKDLEVLSTNVPANEYADVWNGLLVNMRIFRERCVPFTDLDPNADGTYTGEECTKIYNENVPILKETLVLILEDCKKFLQLKETYAVTETETSPPVNNNQYQEHQEKCIECGKNASYSYRNPFSGAEEPYCYTHYNEIIDMMGAMEQDVGNSNQNKHICEMCSKEGTHRYDSFTGQTEYYCTKHYEELMAMLEDFGLE